ncbi:MAG: T9SS type A sorting domain-containing protein [Bacteroidota bacterium]|jgi:hypothetical protein
MIVSVNAQTTDTVKVLFIGNSYVYYNNLPSLFLQLAESGGKKVIVGSSAIGSYKLADHANSASTLSLIGKKWNTVVLQEQSVLPVIEYLREKSMTPSVNFLDSVIRTVGASTMLYLTWGRKYGGAWSVGGYSTINFQNYHQMQDSLTSAYREVADKLHVRMSPVGIAWKNAVTENSSIDLWISDNSHPTMKGSYLAACTFYSAIFNTSPVGLKYTAGLDTTDVVFLQKQAATTLTTVVSKTDYIPVSFILMQNYPNPFNPTTVIKYQLPLTSKVSLKIYDLLGREIVTLVNEEQSAGWKEVEWNAKDVSSGIYFYKLSAGSFVETKKMLVVK